MRGYLLAFATLIGSGAATANAQITWWFDLDDSCTCITQGIIDQITNSMDVAVDTYNAYSTYDVSDVSDNSSGIRVVYYESVSTANASYRGRIAFGGSRGISTAMHEMSHVLGVGTYWTWDNNRDSSINRWTGDAAIAEVRFLNDNPESNLNADGSHFWPYGLNQSSEDSAYNRYGNVRMVGALREDMGLSNRNASNMSGDYNNDGLVNAADYVVFRDRVGETNSLINDTTLGSVSSRDYLPWSDNYGTNTRNPGPAPIPEPAGLATLLIGATILGGRARRKR